MTLHRASGGHWAVLALLAALGAGCGPALYSGQLRDAERVFDQAVEENARWYAPYEFHFAEVHLEKAREEAAEASYEDAVRFARTAEDFSKRALEITQRKRRGMR